MADLLGSLTRVGLRPEATSADEMRVCASRLMNSLSTLGVGTYRSVPKPWAEDPFALAHDWAGPHITPRRLDTYPLYGTPLADGHLGVVSPRGMAMAHATFLCRPCHDAHAAGTFVPDCYIHTLAALLMGVRCMWGPAGPPPETPATRPSRRAEASDADKAWLEAEHDKMVAAGKAETLTADQVADPAVCALIAPVRVATKWAASADAPTSSLPSDLAAAAKIAASSAADSILMPETVIASEQGSRFTQLMASLSDNEKRRFVMGCHVTVNLWTPPKSLRYATIHDAVAPAPPGCAMRGSDGKAAFYQLPLHPDHKRYFCYELPSGRIGRQLRCCFGGNCHPSASAFVMAEVKSIIRGGYPAGALGGGAPPRGDEAPDVGRGVLRRPPQVAALHARRQETLNRGGLPDMALSTCLIVTGVLDDVLEVAGRDLEGPSVAWSKAVLEYVSVTSNTDKEFYSVTPDALGAHVKLAEGSSPTSVSPKSDKLRATLEQCHLWLRLVEARGSWSVPFTWIESLDGSVGWLAQFYRRLRLVKRPIGSLVYRARAQGSALVRLDLDSPATRAVRTIVMLAESNSLRPVTYFPSSSLAAASLTIASNGAARSPEDQALYDRLTRELQAMGGTRFEPTAAGLLAVASTSSDGSRDASGAAWGIVLDDGQALEASHGVVAEPEAHSDFIELLPILSVAERRFPSLRRRLVVIRSDNLGNVYRINNGRCDPDSPCFSLLDRLFELADAHEIELLALWCPRAANSALDALASLRRRCDVDAWCAAHGIALY